MSGLLPTQSKQQADVSGSEKQGKDKEHGWIPVTCVLQGERWS